ncbi:ATP-binding protein [Streptomyces sp. SAI-041]|uniref:sensor histidine kinase n=1 Tax=Streptomyces sp. SAI-041 TaxID=2940548 RepID=UPI0024767C39|nr:ATP-binding protein [Streptomyces sp. SAI-041]MDH6546290.1 signal transduction histidine kinase [Streptomyces sp. SAI-041]
MALSGTTELTADGLTSHRDLRSAPMSGDPVLLERMTVNLVVNAVRHNRPAGRFRISTGHQANGAYLRVANTGRVIPAQRVDRLLRPFVRGDGSPPKADGAGLGLSIVQAVVLTHGGEITAATNPGGVLDVVVRFPAGSEDPDLAQEWQP